MAAAGAGDGLSDTANRVAIGPAVLAQGLVADQKFTCFVNIERYMLT